MYFSDPPLILNFYRNGSKHEEGEFSPRIGISDDELLIGGASLIAPGKMIFKIDNCFVLPLQSISHGLIGTLLIAKISRYCCSW